MDNLPDIDFDGKLVVPLNGKYKCPYRCHARGFPAPVWKTEKGFRKHMAGCQCSPSAQARMAAQSAKRVEDAALAAAEAARELGLRLGDEVSYVGYRVTAPTHVMRGTRRVRVRYEELRSYFGATVKVDSFTWVGSLVLNGCIPVSNLCPSLPMAQAKAVERQRDYQAHLDFSASVR